MSVLCCAATCISKIRNSKDQNLRRWKTETTEWCRLTDENRDMIRRKPIPISAFELRIFNVVPFASTHKQGSSMYFLCIKCVTITLVDYSLSFVLKKQVKHLTNLNQTIKDAHYFVSDIKIITTNQITRLVINNDEFWNKF